jgi:tetratricopeptide (TPR) repeat protein
MLVSLLSVFFSACATQSLSTTLSSSNVQTVKHAQPSKQEPAQSVASHVFARGQEALEAGRYQSAIDLFGQAIEIDATNALYYLWLGRAYGHQAEQAKAGGQFFLARQVRKNLEKAVTLNPDLIEARLDLLTYYLRAPGLLGGGMEKAQAQAVEITKRDPRKGALAWQQCRQAKEEGASLLAVSR